MRSSTDEFFTSQNSSTPRVPAAENHQTTEPSSLNPVGDINKFPYAQYMSGAPIGEGKISGRPIAADVFGVISDFTPGMAILNAHAAASSIKAGAEQLRKRKITIALLKAVAYGMAVFVKEVVASHSKIYINCAHPY